MTPAYVIPLIRFLLTSYLQIGSISHTVDAEDDMEMGMSEESEQPKTLSVVISSQSFVVDVLTHHPLAIC